MSLFIVSCNPCENLGTVCWYSAIDGVLLCTYFLHLHWYTNVCLWSTCARRRAAVMEWTDWMPFLNNRTNWISPWTTCKENAKLWWLTLNWKWMATLSSWFLTICLFRAINCLRPMPEHPTQYYGQSCGQSDDNVSPTMRLRRVPSSRHYNILDRLAVDHTGRIHGWCLYPEFDPPSTIAASPFLWCRDRPMCHYVAIANSILRCALKRPTCDAVWCSFAVSPAPRSVSAIWWWNRRDFCRHCKQVNCDTNDRRSVTDQCSALHLVPIKWWIRFAHSATAHDSPAHCFPLCNSVLPLNRQKSPNWWRARIWKKLMKWMCVGYTSWSNTYSAKPSSVALSSCEFGSFFKIRK